MTFPVHYQPAAKVAPGPTPGAKALMAWCLAHYHGTNLGIYNPRNVRGGQALSLHAEGRAIDVGYPTERPDGHVAGRQLAADMVRLHAALGVQCVIFARSIWTNTRPIWRPYTGTADHFDHVHIELTREAAAGLTTDIIRQTLEATTVPTDNPYPAETAEALELLAQHADYTGDRKWFGPLALQALHRLKNDKLAAEKLVVGLNIDRDATATARQAAEAAAFDLRREAERLKRETDTAVANREAAEAEALELRRQLQEGGRMPQLLADLDAAVEMIDVAIGKARA